MQVYHVIVTDDSYCSKQRSTVRRVFCEVEAIKQLCERHGGVWRLEVLLHVFLHLDIQWWDVASSPRRYTSGRKAHHHHPRHAMGAMLFHADGQTDATNPVFFGRNFGNTPK
jgi:hypothetical protein